MSRIACALCHWLRRLLGWDDPLWLEAAERLRQEIQFGDWNTDALFKADACPERLRELSALWDVKPREAFPLFLAQAEAGSVWSMIRVGCGYSAGVGVARDAKRAETWLTSAFEHGSDYGLIWGARMARGRRDIAKARRMLDAGVARGLVQAKVDLACLILDRARTGEERDHARSLFESAIAEGYLPARGELALSMATGDFGWRAVPEGVRRFREHVRTTGDLIEARKRQMIAGVEIPHGKSDAVYRSANEPLHPDAAFDA